MSVDGPSDRARGSRSSQDRAQLAASDSPALFGSLRAELAPSLAPRLALSPGLHSSAANACDTGFHAAVTAPLANMADAKAA